MSNNYTVYHLHSDLSNGTTTMDSVTKYKMYIHADCSTQPALIYYTYVA